MNKRSHLKAGAQQAPHFPWENREISPLHTHSLQERRLPDQRTEDPALGIQPQAQAPSLQDDSQRANWRQNHPPSDNPRPRFNQAETKITNLSRLGNEEKEKVGRIHKVSFWQQKIKNISESKDTLDRLSWEEGEAVGEERERLLALRRVSTMVVVLVVGDWASSLSLLIACFRFWSEQRFLLLQRQGERAVGLWLRDIGYRKGSCVLAVFLCHLN